MMGISWGLMQTGALRNILLGKTYLLKNEVKE